MVPNISAFFNPQVVAAQSNLKDERASPPKPGVDLFVEFQLAQFKRATLPLGVEQIIVKITLRATLS